MCDHTKSNKISNCSVSICNNFISRDFEGKSSVKESETYQFFVHLKMIQISLTPSKSSYRASKTAILGVKVKCYGRHQLGQTDPITEGPTECS